MGKEIWKPKNLLDIFITNGAKFSEKTALVYKPDHRYYKLSYGELLKEIIKASEAFKKLGIKKDDRVVLISENRPEWVISDVALMSIEAIVVPIHKVLAPEQITMMLEEINPVAIIISDEEIFLKLKSHSLDLFDHIKLISFEKLLEEQWINFHEIIDKEDPAADDIDRFIKQGLSVDPKRAATIIYTSGTAGRSKAAVLSHSNCVSAIVGTYGFSAPLPKDCFFSVLPLSHVAERITGYYVPMSGGSKVVYCLSLSSFSEEFLSSKPSLMLTVPRMLEKIHDKIHDAITNKPILKIVFNYAFSQVLKKPNGIRVLFWDKVLFSRIRRRLGAENIRLFMSAGAPLSDQVNIFLNTIGLTTREGYGLTETASLIIGCPPESRKIGTIGIPMQGTCLRLSDEGEVLLKGPSVFEKYLNTEDTKQAFTKDGFFKTGDFGEFDEDGYLIVKGRHKDLIILSTGKKIVPQLIEERLELSKYINQALVIGNGRKHIMAIIVLSTEVVSKKIGISPEKVLRDMRVVDLINEEIELLQKGLSKIERIKKYILSTEPFSLENNQLTISFKKRRQEIIKHYERKIEEVYKTS